MSDEIQKQKEDASNFLRLGRSLREDLLNGLLEPDEFPILVWLLLGANPHNGTVKTGYAELSSDFKNKFSENRANKILLALKRKKYLLFERRQGRRGSFLVRLNNYPLSSGKFSDLAGQFEVAPGRSAETGSVRSGAEVTEEVTHVEQKFFQQKKTLVKRFSINAASSDSRSAKNENKNNKNSISFKKRGGYETSRFEPRTHAEQRCLDIARTLGEPSVAFILAKLKIFGISTIESAWERTSEAIQKGSVKDKRKYFNAVLCNLAEGRSEGNFKEGRAI